MLLVNSLTLIALNARTAVMAAEAANLSKIVHLVHSLFTTSLIHLHSKATAHMVPVQMAITPVTLIVTALHVPLGVHFVHLPLSAGLASRAGVEVDKLVSRLVLKAHI